MGEFTCINYEFFNPDRLLTICEKCLKEFD